MKRLFRKWLKRQIIRMHTPFEQQVFEWIYDSSISTWKDRLLCVKEAPDTYKDAYGWLIESK